MRLGSCGAGPSKAEVVVANVRPCSTPIAVDDNLDVEATAAITADLGSKIPAPACRRIAAGGVDMPTAATNERLLMVKVKYYEFQIHNRSR